MPSLMQHSVSIGGSGSATVPVVTIAGQVIDDDGHTVLADFTGQNAIQFPQILAQLTTAQRHEILDRIATYLLYAHAGVV